MASGALPPSSRDPAAIDDPVREGIQHLRLDLSGQGSAPAPLGSRGNPDHPMAPSPSTIHRILRTYWRNS